MKKEKAYQLTPIPDEIRLIKLIFEKFLEIGSQTKVEQFVLEKRDTTKKGNNFTRFSIKAILENPVYVIADRTAYDYLLKRKSAYFPNRASLTGSMASWPTTSPFRNPARHRKRNPWRIGSWLLVSTPG